MKTINFVHKAKEALNGKDVRRLAAIHAGVTMAFGLVLTLLQYVILDGIGNTSGLSGMGMRSILETMNTVLQVANLVLLPFWNLGFLYVALQWVRGNQPENRDLLTGFRRVGPCLGLLLNRLMLAICVLILAANVSSMLYMQMPSSQWIRDLAADFTDLETMQAYLFSMDMEQTMAILWDMIPLVVMNLALSAVILIPMFYRFRMAEFTILNYPGMRGLAALLVSAALMRRRCWQLFKLDLRLWWYYGLKLLCMLILYLNVILSVLGITVGSDLLFITLYLAGVFIVDMLFRPLVDTAYSAFYEKLVELGPIPKKRMFAMPQQMPPEE